jgi:hypothetical protein
MSLPTRRPTLIALFALVVLFGAARAGGEDEASKHELNEQRALLKQRSRSTMHPGDPFVLVGVEQGGNDLRSRSPALKNGVLAPQQIDAEELRQKKLGLYGGEIRAPQAVTIVRKPPQQVPRVDRTRAGRAVGEGSSNQGLGIVLVSLLATASIGIWCFRRYRRMSTNMEDDLHVPGRAAPPLQAAPADSSVVRFIEER